MNRILQLLVLLSGMLVYAQDQVTITLKNGTELSGYGRVTDAGVKYKPEKKGRYKNITAPKIEKVVVRDDQFNTVTPYVYRVLKKGQKPKLVSMAYQGDKIALFVQQIKIKQYNKFTKTFDDGFGIPKWYVLRKGERIPTYFSNDKRGLNIVNSFKKTAKEYFSDCEALVNKIGSKGFRKGNIYEIVYYYENNCGS